MSRKIVPLGDRYLVKRRRIGEKIGKAGILFTPDTTADRPTDLADVIYCPDLSFADKELIDNADEIIKSLVETCKDGDGSGLKTLLEFNQFLKIKSIQPGDLIMMGRYTGIDFHTNSSGESITLVRAEDIVGVIVQENENKVSENSIVMPKSAVEVLAVEAYPQGA